MKNIPLKIIQYFLKIYAIKVIGRHKPIVIAITGSVGKTSTKEAIFAVLKSEYGTDVWATSGNLNAEIGIPLTILGYKKLPNKFLWPVFLILAYFKTNIRKYPKYLILEMGVDKPGDIEYYTEIVKPDYAIITSVMPAHISNFDSVAEYQKEKISLITHLKENGIGIVNGDDEVLGELSGDRIIKVGIKNKNFDFWADTIAISLKGADFRINSLGYKIAIRSKLIGKHFIYSQLFAFAVAKSLGIKLLEAAKSLEKIKPIPGRLNIINGKNNISILDDTYNSNPTSLEAALLLLGQIEHKGRKVAILGNMNELGDIEKKAHIEAGNQAKGKVDLAVFVGKNAKNMLEGYGDNPAIIFNNREELENQINEIIQPNDLVLVKASQNNNFFEEIVKKIMKNPGDASRLLVRQGRYWSSKK